MTIKEAVLKSLDDIKVLTNYLEIYNHIVKNNYYDFKSAKTPSSTISAALGDYIRNEDTRVKRIKQVGGTYSYYLTKFEGDIDIDSVITKIVEDDDNEKEVEESTFDERDLHKLLSSYLKNTGIFTKTIFHEKSYSRKDSHHKWVHPDLIGIKFLKLQNDVSQKFLKATNRGEAFKLFSYELKKEINSDYELKRYFFQAVSNSSWANYGYLVAFEISDSLNDEMERLNQSFGIGIIELRANPYESKVLFAPKYRDVDIKTIDKLCNINKDFEQFIEQTEKIIVADERYFSAIQKEFDEFCDNCFLSNAEMNEYCKKKNIKEL